MEGDRRKESERGRKRIGAGDDGRGWEEGQRKEEREEDRGYSPSRSDFVADRIFHFYHIAKNSARTACFIQFISIRPHAVSVLAFVPIFLEQSASVCPPATLFLVSECFSGRSKKVTKKNRLINKQI